MPDASLFTRLLGATLDPEAARHALAALAIDPGLARSESTSGAVARGSFAMALNVALFTDLLARVPSAAAYAADRLRHGLRLHFDHGALRTICFAQGGTGALPPGEAAFSRLLEPLGYRVAGTYPLPALRMTGRAYRHLDHPDTIPQFFVSELHVDRFDQRFADAAARVFGSSRDPITPEAQAVLNAYAAGQPVSIEAAAAALPILVGAFGVHHDMPRIDDYETLLAESPEAAWIATEGNAFNHATDRVDNVEALAARLRAEGWPIKDTVEVSASGRVRQTALRADKALRSFRGRSGETLIRSVPGSFYEFITRDFDPDTGMLDLGFDSGNATGIFAMTKVA